MFFFFSNISRFFHLTIVLEVKQINLLNAVSHWNFFFAKNLNRFLRKLGQCGLVQVLLFSIEGQMKSMTGAEIAASSNSPRMTSV